MPVVLPFVRRLESTEKFELFVCTEKCAVPLFYYLVDFAELHKLLMVLLCIGF
jgi:hypothetical protein